MSIPPPPWRVRTKRGGGRKPLSQEAVVAAAMGLLDCEGLDAVSMRRVAQVLGTGAASLYAHVKDKEELLELLLDRGLGEVSVPVPEPGLWQEQLKVVARQMRQMFQRHPGLAEVSLGRIPVGPHGIAVAEGVMALGRAGGLEDRVVGLMVDLFTLYVGAASYEETLLMAREGPAGMQGFLDRLRQIKNYYLSLPVARFPNVVALGHTMMADEDEDERFEFALDVLLRGIATYIPAAQR